MLFKNHAYQKNSTRLFNICRDLIRKYERHDMNPSCEGSVMELIERRVYDAKDELSTWKDSEVDYIMVAHSQIVSATFDLLVSGKFHLYYGVLNPMSCASNMIDVYDSCMEWAFNNHQIDDDTRKEQRELLNTGISEIG